MYGVWLLEDVQKFPGVFKNVFSTSEDRLRAALPYLHLEFFLLLEESIFSSWTWTTSFFIDIVVDTLLLKSIKYILF